MLLGLSLVVLCLVIFSINGAVSCPVVFESSDGHSMKLGEVKFGKCQAGHAQETTANCTSANKGSLRVVDKHLEFCDGESWVRLSVEEKPRPNTRETPGIDCQDIKRKGHSVGDGMYWLDPDGGSHSNAFLAYCDMTSYGGGWTMCYTTDEFAKPKSEVTHKPQLPYGKDGYRTNCNNIPFTEIIFVDHNAEKQAYFKRKSNLPVTAADNYGKRADTYELWDGVGAMSSAYSYQLLICDTSFYSGFFVSGYTSCYKQCNSWCGDTKSPYFRTASTSGSYKGVAFNTNGHRPLDTRLMSVGLR